MQLLNRALQILCFSSLFLITSCVRFSSENNSEIIARVNSNPVYLNEFLLNYNQLKAGQDEIFQRNPKMIEKLKTRALNEVIITALVEQEAERANIRIAKEEVEGRFSNWKDSYPPGGFEDMLNKKGITEAFTKKRIREQLLIEKLAQVLFASETLASDEEMKDHFEKHQKEFIRPATVHALQIVVPTLEEAQKIRQEIASGKLTFQSAARQYSLSPDAARGGDLGFYSKNEKIPAFNDAFEMSVNEISEPIKSQYGYHLLKVVEKRPSKKLGFLEAKSDIAGVIRNEKQVRIYKEWLQNLLKEGKIYRNERLFASLD